MPKESARIPADSSAVRYGTGCFETFRTDAGKFFKLGDHIDRLNRGIDYLSFGQIAPVIENDLKEQILKLLEKNDLPDSSAKVRVQFLLDEKSGYNVDENPAHSVLITVSELKPQREMVSLATVKTIVIPTSSRPTELKLSNMLHYRQAWREASQHGANDALMLTQDGFVAETSIANLFWIKENTVFTPDTACDILPGVMRNCVIGFISDQLGLNVQEGKYRLDELNKAETVWITNSVREIQFVRSIDGQEFDTDSEFCNKLLSDFERLKEEKLR